MCTTDLHSWPAKIAGTMEDPARASRSSGFGALLRRYRLEAGLSQAALAEVAGMSANGIGALERGYRRTPQRETLALLASALALDAAERRSLEAAAARSAERRHSGTSVTVGPWPNVTASNLPLALASFVGREVELDEIADLVREHRLVTLTGTGGVGKTQTALHVGAALSENSEIAVFFVGLAPIGNPSLVVTRIASTLGVQEVPNRSLLETLLAYTKTKALLLIFDNCEHVIAEAARVAEALLARCPHIRILTTSREPLRAAGEQVYRLPSLDGPDAVVLFGDRARAADHRFALTDKVRPIVAEICGRLDGIPLAIELAAARANLLSVRAIADKLDACFQILISGERTALPRQQTMRATIDWSYNLLSPQERRLFERLAIFAGGCTLGAARAVCAADESEGDGALGLLASLVDKSLVVNDNDERERRYHLPESFRQYAREKLVSQGENHAFARRHALAYLELAQWLDRAYDSEPDHVWLELAHREADNWRAALQWTLIDRGDIVLGQRLVGELRVLWEFFAPLEGRRWLVPALALIDDRTPPSVVAKLNYAEADVAWQLRDYHLQLTSSESAIARYRAVGDTLGAARSQNLAAQALICFERFSEAKALLEKVLAAARQLANRRLIAYALRGLGYVSAASGDITAARAFVAEAQRNYEAIGAKLPTMAASHDLAWFEFCAGNAEVAIRHQTEAIATARSFSARRLEGILLSALAGYLLAVERYDEAAEGAREVLALARELQLDALAAEGLQHLIAIAALRPREPVDRTPELYSRLAQVLGFVDARLVVMGSRRIGVLQPEYDRVLAVLGEANGADALAKLMAAGAAMTEEQAVEEAYAT